MDDLTNRADPSELDIRAYLNVIWRRKWVVVASLGLVTAVTMAVTLFFITPKYQSSTEILQRQSGLDRALLGSDLFQQLGSQPERELQTAAELIKSPEVLLAVREKLGTRLAGQDLDNSVQAKPVSKANMINITVTNADPLLASDIANAFAAEYIAWRQQVDKDVLLQARAPTEAQLASVPPEEQESASYRVLKDKVETLKLIEAMQVGNLEVVKPATVSTVPVSPKPFRTGAMALFVSLIGGVGIAFGMEHLDTKVRSTDEVSKRVGTPILATVPVVANMNGSLITLSHPLGACAEAYRMLKTNLGYIEPDKEIKTIMVTSPEPGEGKSTTIANLAITMARAGQKVIVIEADWRRPKLDKYFKLESTIGITNALSGNCSFREALQMIDAKDLVISGNNGYEPQRAYEQDPQSLDGVKPIYCATSGPIPPNPGELASSDKLRTLIDEASQYADFVLIDAPPFGVVGDAASIAANVDGVVMVVRLAQTAKRSLGLMQNFMDSVPSKILGLVITDANAGGTYSYNYGGYYYSYDN